MMTVKLRYKAPEGQHSAEVGYFVSDVQRAFASASTDFRFAASVAEFGMLLRDSEHKGQATFQQVIDIASGAQAEDERRRELVALVRRAQKLSG